MGLVFRQRGERAQAEFENFGVALPFRIDSLSGSTKNLGQRFER
jgi:hypothetical protein